MSPTVVKRIAFLIGLIAANLVLVGGFLLFTHDDKPSTTPGPQPTVTRTVTATPSPSKPPTSKPPTSQPPSSPPPSPSTQDTVARKKVRVPVHTPTPRKTPNTSRSTVRPPATGSPKAYARSVLGSGQFSCLDALAIRESGWNVYATNPSSGAYGIGQALPGSKMASAGADWRTNGVTQVRWMISYVNGRYGSACGAWNFWQNHHWY